MSILEEAAIEGRITCRNCGEYIEPDCEQCSCGWNNPLVEMGMI